MHGPHDHLRISDADRHAVAERLREAAGEGRIDLEELDERLEQTYAAKTYGDLVPLTADLPLGGANLPVPRPGALPVPQGTGLEPTYDSSFSVMGEVVRKGVWVVPERHTVFTLMAGGTIDLRQAIFSGPEIVIIANAVMAGIDVYVNAQTRIVCEGVGIMGTFGEGRHRVEPDLHAGSPTVRVKGMALMGAVDVTRRPMPGEKKKKGLLRGR